MKRSKNTSLVVLDHLAYHLADFSWGRLSFQCCDLFDALKAIKVEREIL